MALDLGLVTHAADREPIEASTQGIGDGAADRSLAHAGRTHQQDDGAGDFALVDANRQEFEDALLHIRQPVVVAVQNTAGALQIQFVRGVLPPGQQGDPVEIVAGHRVFRRAGLQDRHLLEFLADALLGLLREREFGQTRLELIQLGGPVILGQPQLLLDGLELLLQEELTLLLLHPLLDRVADFLLRLGQLQLIVEQHQHLFHARQERHRLQHFLQLLFLGGGEAGGEVGQMRGIIRAETVQKHAQLFHIQRVERQQFLNGVDHRHRIGAHFIVRRTGGLRQVRDPGIEGDLAMDPAFDMETLQALDQHLQMVILTVHPMHAAGGADGVKVLGAGLLRSLAADQHDAEDLVLGGADRLNGGRPMLRRHHERHRLTREKGSGRHR